MTNVCISEYENERKFKLPSLETIYDLANALDVSIDWLCDCESNSKCTMALWNILEWFSPEIKINEDGTPYAILEFKGMNADFSQVEVAKFLKGYVQIQEFKNSNLVSKEIIKELEEALLKEYQHLPGLPPYRKELL